MLHPKSRLVTRHVGFLCIMATAVTGVQTASATFPIRSRQIGSVTYVNVYDVARYYGLKVYFSGDKVNLYSRESGNSLQLDIGRRAAIINAAVCHLSFAPAMNGNTVMLSAADFTNIVDSILRPASLPQHRVRKIAIDAGHGGIDNGARGRHHLEKDINLKLARLLKSRLEEIGYKVKLTRSNDTFINLSHRCKIARKWDADVFVSIHCNATGKSGVHGMESFILSPVGTPNTSEYKINGERTSGNAFDSLNARLAYEIHRHLLAETGGRDRGIKHERFLVLRKAPCPAVLVETGFLSNPTEEKKLGDPVYQRRIARSIATGIAAYVHAIDDDAGQELSQASVKKR